MKMIGDSSAFPVPEEGEMGMSIRDYFIAHAPAEPQPWFVPVMPKKPEIPNRYTELSEADNRELDRLDEFAQEQGNKAIAAFLNKRDAAFDAQKEWEKEAAKERYLQWPMAWANEIITRMEGK